MAIRNDITFDWAASPRQVTVDSPSTELSMQDLLDTLRHNEALDSNIDNQQIVNGNGKVVLDALGNATGLTVQLVNATVGFETRPGPSWVECGLSGGNISGLESDFSTVTTQVTHNNPFVNINKTSSVSATISAAETDEILAYNNVLHFDANNTGGVGQTYPVGTSANPVNNLIDGIVIATKYFLVSVHTHSDVLMDRDVEKFNILGVIPDLVIDANGFKMNLCQLKNMHVVGDFNNSLLHIVDCEVQTVTNIYGKIKDSYLVGTITIAANEDLTVTDSESGIAGATSPIIDMCVGESTTLSMRGYSGGLTLINSDTSACVSTLEFIAGRPHLEPSCTAGYSSIRGVATLDDRSNGMTVDTLSLLDPVQVKELHQLQGLDIDNPMTMTPTQRVVDGIDLSVSGDGENVSVVQRQ